MQYKQNRYTGCRSKNFLPEGWKLITLERLFQSVYGKSLHQPVYSIRDYEERVRFQFGDRDVEQLLADEPYYPGEIKRRVQRIIRRQKNKYQYKFN